MSPPPEFGLRAPENTPEYSAEERSLLLRLAHDSIAAAFQGREVSVDPPCQHLAEPRGAFTTIYVHGELHGCVGYAVPIASLYRTVAETARAAAFDDTRFQPLRPEELPALQVSISVLSLLQAIEPEQIEIGHHGLVITMESQRGLLLPQVAAERNWDRETFLGQTCRKAGLAANAWRSGAKIEAFTAEVFADPGVKE